MAAAAPCSTFLSKSNQDFVVIYDQILRPCHVKSGPARIYCPALDRAQSGHKSCHAVWSRGKAYSIQNGRQADQFSCEHETLTWVLSRTTKHSDKAQGQLSSAAGRIGLHPAVHHCCMSFWLPGSALGACHGRRPSHSASQLCRDQLLVCCPETWLSVSCNEDQPFHVTTTLEPTCHEIARCSWTHLPEGVCRDRNMTVKIGSNCH